MTKNSQMRPCHTTPSVIHTKYGGPAYSGDKSPNFGSRGSASGVKNGKSGKGKK